MGTLFSDTHCTLNKKLFLHYYVYFEVHVQNRPTVQTSVTSKCLVDEKRKKKNLHDLLLLVDSIIVSVCMFRITNNYQNFVCIYPYKHSHRSAEIIGIWAYFQGVGC